MKTESHEEKREPEGHGPVKSFLEHLEDLRWVLTKVIATLTISCVACFSFGPGIFRILQYPMRLAGIEEPSKFLKIFGPMESFLVAFNLAFYAGLVIAAPLVIYFIVSYVLPAMTRREQHLVMPVFWLGGLFFMGGVLFCYFAVLPPTLALSLKFTDWLNLSVDFWTVGNYVGFVTKFMLCMGIAFEFPLVILLLVRFGVLDYAKLSKGRPYIIVLIFIIAAVLTPTPDVFTQLLLAAPLTVMFEACIWVAWFMERRRRKREEIRDPRGLTG